MRRKNQTICGRDFFEPSSSFPEFSDSGRTGARTLFYKYLGTGLPRPGETGRDPLVSGCSRSKTNRNNVNRVNISTREGVRDTNRRQTVVYLLLFSDLSYQRWLQRLVYFYWKCLLGYARLIGDSSRKH